MRTALSIVIVASAAAAGSLLAGASSGMPAATSLRSR